MFTDVDLALQTSLDFFDAEGDLILSQFVTEADMGLSFLGVVFDDASVARVRITLGNAALGPNDGGGVDVVALDDFIYAEPQAVAEPPVPALLGTAILAAALFARRRFVLPG